MPRRFGVKDKSMAHLQQPPSQEEDPPDHSSLPPPPRDDENTTTSPPPPPKTTTTTKQRLSLAGIDPKDVDRFLADNSIGGSGSARRNGGSSSNDFASSTMHLHQQDGNGGQGGGERDEIAEVKKLASKETCNVRIMRMIIVVLIAIAFVVTFVTFRLLKQEQTQSFEAAFAQFSRALADAATQHRIEVTEAFKALSEAITANEITSLPTFPHPGGFPFYHLPHYEHYVQSYMDQGGIELASVGMRVRHSQLPQWIPYVNDTYKQWVFEGHMYQHGNLHNLNPVGYKPYPTAAVPGQGLVAYADLNITNKEEYYFHWSSYPAPATYLLMNWDFTSVPDYQKLADAMQTLKNETLVSKVRSYAVLIGTSFTKEYHDSLHGPIPDGETEYPHSIHFHAILDRMVDPNNPIEDANVVGFLAGGVAWDHSMKNLLPEGVAHITAVVENDCNQSYTFDIDGPRANFVGTGDFHEMEYDKYKVTANLDVHKHPLSDDIPGHCKYHLSLYPSQKFEDAYQSNTPQIFAIVVATCFLLIALAMFLYHTLVEKRNAKLIQRTALSQGVVTQLFPEQVRDQLLKEAEEKQQQQQAAAAAAAAATSPTATIRSNSTDGTGRIIPMKSLKDFVSVRDQQQREGNDGQENSGRHFQIMEQQQPKKIIADHFKESTILFADMAGFTSWSSAREPQDVFLLLETLYAAFDEIAKRRGVYKVETIGDCYVAVTGVPNIREDHALVMVKFARDIMIKMSVETKKLEDSLGPETGNLKLRAGMHSGPVTAGVLRGDRARFQLFGDTMNTASRMESTGMPGRIQLSEQTADYIRNYGKETWLVERPDGVQAKGKGRLRTWFLVLGNDRGTETTITSKSEDDSEERVQLF